METFEVMFDDLTEEAQQRFLKFQGLENPNDGRVSGSARPSS